MFIYNVTVKLDKNIHREWLEWMQQIHIPEVMQTGCFAANRLLKLLESNESDGFTYTVQYTASSKADYDRYIEKYAAALRKSTINKWGNSIIAFRTLMEVIN